LSVLDVSGAALARAQERLGTAAERVRWIEADVTGDWIASPVDFWHDRAVFHFLTDADDRARYVERARRQVKRDGHVVVATFAPDGPPKCSGLPVVRYDAGGLAAEFGPSFTLEHTVEESHTTPAGGIQHFTYAVFRRNLSQQ
jgi:SAM-dependent methyltransferase